MPSPVPFRFLQVLLLLATQWPVKSNSQFAWKGGSPVEALQLHSNTQSHWSNGSTVCSLPRGAAVRIPGTHPHLQWNQVLLLVMSCYNIRLKRPMSDDIPLSPTYFSIWVPTFACIYQHGPQPKFFPFELWLRSKGTPKLYHLSAIPFRFDTARCTGGSDKSHVIVSSWQLQWRNNLTGSCVLSAYKNSVRYVPKT